MTEIDERRLHQACDILLANRPPDGQALYSQVRAAIDLLIPFVRARLIKACPHEVDNGSDGLPARRCRKCGFDFFAPAAPHTADPAPSERVTYRAALESVSTCPRCASCATMARGVLDLTPPIPPRNEGGGR